MANLLLVTLLMVAISVTYQQWSVGFVGTPDSVYSDPFDYSLVSPPIIESIYEYGDYPFIPATTFDFDGWQHVVKEDNRPEPMPSPSTFNPLPAPIPTFIPSPTPTIKQKMSSSNNQLQVPSPTFIPIPTPTFKKNSPATYDQLPASSIGRDEPQTNTDYPPPTIKPAPPTTRFPPPTTRPPPPTIRLPPPTTRLPPPTVVPNPSPIQPTVTQDSISQCMSCTVDVLHHVKRAAEFIQVYLYE